MGDHGVLVGYAVALPGNPAGNRTQPVRFSGSPLAYQAAAVAVPQAVRAPPEVLMCSVSDQPCSESWLTASKAARGGTPRRRFREPEFLTADE